MKLSTFLYMLVSTAAAASHNDRYILAPSSRSIRPKSIYQAGGNITNAPLLITDRTTSVAFGKNAYVTLDFGKAIAGTVSFNVESVSGADQAIGFTFTESSAYISAEHCDATQPFTGFDLPLWFNLTVPGFYEASKEHQRGSFRYLTVVHNDTGSVSLSNITVHWTASPEMVRPAAYTGSFHSSSEKLNRVWYAGAYTNQLCSIDPTTGRSLGLPVSGWHYNYTIANGTSVLVDGGKRDRLIWPGDIAISGPSIFVSTNSLEPIRNGIDALLLQQQSDGAFPWAGTPFASIALGGPGFIWSFTYHCHTLNNIYDYHLFTGDVDYLISTWDQYKLGMNFLLQFIDSSGLANVTSSNDWLRNGMGGHNIEANSILYYTLKNAIKLAAIVNDTSDVSTWNASASNIPPAVNTLLWDDSTSMYRDNDTNTTIYPQDGNSWAVISGIATGVRAEAISAALKSRWIRPYGAPAPEAGPTISPFASGFEIQAHYIAGHADRAVDLIEFMWADFMLEDPRMTNSSFIEGYSTNGSLHYPAYINDASISLAHGWSTGPTSSLTFYGGGMMVTAAGGRTWRLAPAMGSLENIKASFETPLGVFSVEWHNNKGCLTGNFATPESTIGTIEIPVSSASKTLLLEGPNGIRKIPTEGLSVAKVSNLPGGNYKVFSSV